LAKNPRRVTALGIVFSLDPLCGFADSIAS